MSRYEIDIDVDIPPLVRVENLDAEVGAESLNDKLEEVTDEAASFLARQIGGLATKLRPDLASINASKATVKFGLKLVVKNGKLTSWVTEASAEGSIEVSIEFTK